MSRRQVSVSEDDCKLITLAEHPAFISFMKRIYYLKNKTVPIVIKETVQEPFDFNESESDEDYDYKSEPEIQITEEELRIKSEQMSRNAIEIQQIHRASEIKKNYILFENMRKEKKILVRDLLAQNEIKMDHIPEILQDKNSENMVKRYLSYLKSGKCKYVRCIDSHIAFISIEDNKEKVYGVMKADNFLQAKQLLDITYSRSYIKPFLHYPADLEDKIMIFPKEIEELFPTNSNSCIIKVGDCFVDFMIHLTKTEEEITHLRGLLYEIINNSEKYRINENNTEESYKSWISYINSLSNPKSR